MNGASSTSADAAAAVAVVVATGVAAWMNHIAHVSMLQCVAVCCGVGRHPIRQLLQQMLQLVWLRG